MDTATEELIIQSGVPLDFYKTGILYLGANNHKALERCANIGSLITSHKLPLPPSLFSEFVADLTSGEDRLDYRITLDGEPGTGKSYSSLYMAARYAMEMADRHGQDPKDYFSLENCALLQDTAGVTKLLDETDKYQAVVIDDAGIAAGNRNYGTKDNKDIDAIMQVCRTKRWFLIYNAPNRRHVDLHIRELVYAKGWIYKPCHAAGMNIIKIQREKINVNRKVNNEYRQNLTLGTKEFKRKLSFYIEYSTDLLDPFKGIMDKYNRDRDAATDSLIAERAVKSSERKAPKVKPADKWQQKMEDHYGTVCARIDECNTRGEKLKRSDILKEIPDLTDRDVVKMIAMHTAGVQ